MPGFLDDFTKRMAEMRATMDELNHKMIAVEDEVSRHFNLAHQQPQMPKIMHSLEKELLK